MRSFIGEELDVRETMFKELWNLSHELSPWFDIDKVKTYSVYVWTKGDDEDEDYPFGENVFDIYADRLHFYHCHHQWDLPIEAMPIIKKIQDKLKEFERFSSGAHIIIGKWEELSCRNCKHQDACVKSGRIEWYFDNVFEKGEKCKDFEGKY